MDMHVVDDGTMQELIVFMKEHKIFARNRRIVADCLREMERLVSRLEAATRPGCCCACHTAHAQSGATDPVTNRGQMSHGGEPS